MSMLLAKSGSAGNIYPTCPSLPASGMPFLKLSAFDVAVVSEVDQYTACYNSGILLPTVCFLALHSFPL